MSWSSGWIPIQWPGHGDFSSWMPFVVLLGQEKVHLGPYPNWFPWLDFTQNPGKVMDDITFVRSHWWLVSEGFSLSTANSDVQKLPATLYHGIADSLAYAA